MPSWSLVVVVGNRVEVEIEMKHIVLSLPRDQRSIQLFNGKIAAVFASPWKQGLQLADQSQITEPDSGT